jgi:V/A-type H+-transporting ATPase subunit E
MESQLQELIDRIKKEGIETASQGAVKVKAEAEEEAAKIIEAARREADSIRAEAKIDAERSEKAGLAAIEQASRNLILAFKDQIQALLDRIVSASVSASYTADVLKAALPELLKNWAARGSDSVDILVSEGDRAELEVFFNSELAKALKGGVELKAVRNINAGFRVAEKDGSAFYDFSAESVAALLSAYLNPKLAAVLSTAAVLNTAAKGQ